MSEFVPPTRLRALRLARGMSQSDLAFLAGVSQTTVSAAERGMSSPLLLRAIAEVLDTDPKRLLDRMDGLEEMVR